VAEAVGGDGVGVPTAVGAGEHGPHAPGGCTASSSWTRKDARRLGAHGGHVQRWRWSRPSATRTYDSMLRSAVPRAEARDWVGLEIQLVLDRWRRP
jgi:hypothetical protein